jgi:hypothetical protein
LGYLSKITQPWTSNPIALIVGVCGVIAGRENPLGGSTMFDAIFRACFSEFRKLDHEASGNPILLFSDGQDNASHTSLQEVVDICQNSNIAIYAFRSEPNPGLFS